MDKLTDRDRINWLARQVVDIEIHALKQWLGWVGPHSPDRVRDLIDHRIAQERLSPQNEG